MIYFIQAKDTGHIKIGKSEDPHERLKQLQTANHQELKIIFIYDEGDYDESAIHANLEQFNVRGEWFSPHQELFDCIKENFYNFQQVETPNNSSFSVSEYLDGQVTIETDYYFIELVGNKINIMPNGIKPISAMRRDDKQFITIKLDDKL